MLEAWAPWRGECLQADVAHTGFLSELALRRRYVSHSYLAYGLQFVRLPARKGHLELTASDGHKRTFGPGVAFGGKADTDVKAFTS